MSSDVTPPTAPARRTELIAHGDTRVDDWFWLRERDNPAVHDYLIAENSYTEARLAHLAPLRDALFDEIRSHVQEDDESAPAPFGPWEYFTRTRTGSQYGIHLRRARAEVAPEAVGDRPVGREVVVLDENQRAEGTEFFQTGDVEVSPDHRLVAWTEETTGGERYELRVRDLETHTDVAEVVADCYYGLAWSKDSRFVFFTRPDEAMRPFQVWRHEVGTDPSSDALVFEELDERFDVAVGATHSGDWIVITSVSRVTSEVWVVPSANPTSSAACVCVRDEGVEYYVDHHRDESNDRFVILTNVDGAANFKVMTTPISGSNRSTWSELVAHDPNARVANIEVFEQFIVLYERSEGLERLRVLTPDGRDVHEIAMPDVVYSAWPDSNLEYRTAVFRYGYSSMVIPRSVYDYDVASRRSMLVRREPVPNYDAEQYVTSREWATGDDGTKIPISIVRRRDTPLDGSAPLYHYAYGSYEATVEPIFRASSLNLLDRGFVVAISHPRGGGEMGRHWWEQGHLEHKINTFRDFNACTRHLHATGHGSPGRTVARGGSAGGLLMGAITNLAPELYAGVVPEVPFVDVISTMQDPSIPLTVNEWDEWGDPRDEHIYRAMLEYSPYDNLRAGVRYPRLFVTAGLNDPRVQYWEPAKYVAKLRAISPETDVVLKTEMGAGHHGPSGRYDAWRDEAYTQAWILETVGLA